MWIEKRKNSKGIRYVYSDRFKDIKTGKMIRVSVTLNSQSAKARKQAERLLQQKKMQAEVPLVSVVDTMTGITLEEVAQEWVTYTEPIVKSSTMAVQRRRIKRIFTILQPSLPVADMTVAHFEAVGRRLHYTSGLSYTYTRGVISTLYAVMRYAKRKGYTTEDFSSYKLIPRPLTPKELERKKTKFLEPSELKEVLSQLWSMNSRIAMAMEFLSLTGLRCGELLALRECDYNARKKTITVSGTISGGERTTPKNVYSYRTIDLSKRAVDIIKRLMLQNKQATTWGKTYVDNGYIFTTHTGRPLSINGINRLLERVKIPGKKVSTHVFRHTHISMLIEAGIPLRAVMQRVGHNRPETTLSIYTHVTAAMSEEMKKKLEHLPV